MSANKFARRAIGAAALALTSILLLAACNNQYPVPEPVPGQPLTWAQKHRMDMLRYQQINQDRINN